MDAVICYQNQFTDPLVHQMFIYFLIYNIAFPCTRNIVIKKKVPLFMEFLLQMEILKNHV